jgi:hypothetical protein
VDVEATVASQQIASMDDVEKFGITVKSQVCRLCLSDFDVECRLYENYFNLRIHRAL